MIKKILFLLVLTMSLVACMGGETGIINTGEEPPISQNKPVIDPNNKDVNLLVSVVSAPPETNAPTTVEIQYKAEQSDDLGSDFLYYYELRISNTVIKKGNYVDYTKIKFAELNVGTQYSFEVKAYNKITEKVSNSSEIITFRTTNDTATNPFQENMVVTVSLLNSTIKPGEDLEITFNLRNKSDKSFDFLASTNLSSRDKWTLSSNGSPNTIAAGELLTFTMVYTLKEYDSVLSLTCTIEDMDSGVIISAPSKTIKVADTEGALIELKTVEIRTSAAEVFPGETGIKIYFSVKSGINDTITVKDIQARFYDKNGNDLTSYFTDTTTDTKTISSKAEVSISHVFNLLGTMPPGDVYVDATVIADYAGAEITDTSAETVGKIKVVNAGKGIISAWIAYPSGATDGVISVDQELTIYAKVAYSGNLDYNQDGELALDKNALDGMRIVAGSEATTFNLNQIVQWKVKAASIPIKGDLKVYIKKQPLNTSSGLELEFDKEEFLINIQAVNKAEIELETGIELDSYGAKDGQVKAGTEFSLYAKTYNIGKTSAVGTMRVKLSETTLGQFKLAAGEELVKEVALGTKAIWKLKAPLSHVNQTIKVELLKLPEDPNTNEEIGISLTSKHDMKLESIQSAEIKLKNVTALQENAKPGEDSIPIVFDVQNTGGANIRLTEIKANFTQRGVDVSEKWILSETSITNSSTLSAGESRSVTAYYRLKENVFDGSDILGEIIISGEVKAIDTTSEEVVEDLQPKITDIIFIEDVVPAVAVAGNDISSSIGSTIVLDGSGSTDNAGIVSWGWIIYNERGTAMFSTALSGERVFYTIGSDFKVGIYTVELRVNDAKGNGVVKDTLLLTIK